MKVKNTAIDWATLLQETYEERRAKNKSYSYRAFARDLGISQSVLSKILLRKRKVSPAKALHFAVVLKLDRDKFVEMLLSIYRA